MPYGRPTTHVGFSAMSALRSDQLKVDPVHVETIFFTDITANAYETDELRELGGQREKPLISAEIIQKKGGDKHDLRKTSGVCPDLCGRRYSWQHQEAGPEQYGRWRTVRNTDCRRV